jgi:hypothetical protein
MKALVLILFIVLFSLPSYSQDGSPSPFIQKDFQLWLDAGINFKVNKKLDLKFEAAHRRENNLADGNESYIELQARTDPFKFLVFSGGYRFSGWFEQYLVHRVFAFAKFKFDVKRLRINYRIRLDHNFSGELGPLPSHFRNKIKLRYRTRKFPLDPYIAYELFFRTNHWDRRFSQQRMDIGLHYSISKKHKLKGYYRYQQRLNTVSPTKNFILGISYSYDL